MYYTCIGVLFDSVCCYILLIYVFPTYHLDVSVYLSNLCIYINVLNACVLVHAMLYVQCTIQLLPNYNSDDYNLNMSIIPLYPLHITPPPPTTTITTSSCNSYLSEYWTPKYSLCFSLCNIFVCSLYLQHYYYYPYIKYFMILYFISFPI